MFVIKGPSFADSHETVVCPKCEVLTLQRPNYDWVFERWTVRANFLPGLHLTPLKSSKGSLQACNAPPFLQPALCSVFVYSEHAEAAESQVYLERSLIHPETEGSGKPTEEET